MQRLSIKQPQHRFIEIVSFKSVLAIGETITWATAIPKVLRPITGYVNNAASVIGTVLPSADSALVEIKAGTHNQDYGVHVLASTSAGNVWPEDLVLPVWDYNAQ